MSNNNNNNTQMTDLSQLRQEENPVVDPNGNNTSSNRRNNNFNNHVKVNRGKLGISDDDDDDVSYESHGSNDNNSNNNNNNDNNNNDNNNNGTSQSGQSQSQSQSHGYNTRSKRNTPRDSVDNNNNNGNNNNNNNNTNSRQVQIDKDARILQLERKLARQEKREQEKSDHQVAQMTALNDRLDELMNNMSRFNNNGNNSNYERKENGSNDLFDRNDASQQEGRMESTLPPCKQFSGFSRGRSQGRKTSNNNNNNNNNNTRSRTKSKSRSKTNNNNNKTKEKGKGKGKKKDDDMNVDDSANIASQALRNMENITSTHLSPPGSNGNNTNDNNGNYGNNNNNNNNNSNNNRSNKNNSSQKPNADKFHYRYGHPSQGYRDNNGMNGYSNDYQHPSGYSQSQWNTRSNATPHPMFNSNGNPNTNNNNSNNNNGNNGNNDNSGRTYDRPARGSNEYGQERYRFDPISQPMPYLEMQNFMLSQTSTEMRDKALAQFAPAMFRKVLSGCADINERIFIIQVLRQIGIFNRIPSSDKNSFYQREIPFKNIDLVHAVLNECMKYFMQKLRNLMSQDNNDMTEHFKSIDIMLQLSELANEYVRDQGEHTQKSWIHLIITTINKNVTSGTILADYERKKSSELEKPGNKKVLLAGGNKKKSKR